MPLSDGRYYQIWLSDSAVVTPGEINGLPDKLRSYIHDLASRFDPAGDVAEIASLREQRDALVLKLRELEQR
jgi:hypothetical protein